MVTSFEDSLTTIEVNDVLAGATGRVGVYFDPFGLPVLPPSNPAPDVYTLLNDLEGFSASNQYGFQFIPSFCGATLPVGLFARYNYWGCAEWSQPPHAGGPVEDCWLPPPSAGAGCSRVTRLVDTIPPSHAPFIP